MSDLFVYTMCIAEYKRKTAIQPLFISFNVSLLVFFYTYLAIQGTCIFLGTDKQYKKICFFSVFIELPV